MSSLQAETQRIGRIGGEPNSSLTPVVLENLSTRCRSMGACLLFVQPDGRVSYKDAAAAPFFNRFAVPAIESAIQEKLAEMNVGASATTWNILPGITVAAFPYVERRQLTGIVVLISKAPDFDLTENVVRACGKLKVDSVWLLQQAQNLPGVSDEAMLRLARLLGGIIRDQVRLSALESELNNLSGQLANTYEELSLIYQISGGMRINRRPEDFFKQTCLDAIEVMGLRAMGVAFQAGENLAQDPVIYGKIAMPQEEVTRLGAALIAWMASRKTSLLVNDLSKDKTLGWLSSHGHRLLAVPLQRGDQILGCLFGIDKELGDFDSVDSKLLNSIANESAIYLENAMLFDDVHGLMMGLLHSLTSAVDAKDPYTCGHSERVAMLSKMLAQEAGLSEDQVERIYMAGLLHDVGKIGVPEAVLHKPGRLTPEEFDQMKKHPAIGARILNDIKQIKDIIPGVLHHHERYDGKGYPANLAGQDIPLMGRIICLADCFDAMTSTRTYRKALPLEAALAEIRRCSGTQFDPALAEAFVRLDSEKLREVLRHLEASNRLDIRGTKSIAAKVA